MEPIDIIILSNGPGEMATWVLPTLKALSQQWGDDFSQVRISLILSPCPNASGQEVAIAESYPEIDRVQAADYFFSFLLWGKTQENWDWRQQGLVLFLGGDQFFPLVIGKRLGYRTVVYAEWEARWYRWIDHFGIRQSMIAERIPTRYQKKLTVIGDLMTDLPLSNYQLPDNGYQIALLPGSKPEKLAQGVPLCLAIAEAIRDRHPQTTFILPLAPGLSIERLAKFADPNYNDLIQKLTWGSAELNPAQNEGVNRDTAPFLTTKSNLKVKIITQFPAHESLARCHLALTTVGANTAQLASLGIPMIVLLPTQQLEAMRHWDGIPGILAALPGVGSFLAKQLNAYILRKKRLFAWPNIWAKAEIVPELLGELQPEKIAQQVSELLENPDQLLQMRARLQKVRGEAGAAIRLAEVVKRQIDNKEKIESVAR